MLNFLRTVNFVVIPFFLWGLTCAQLRLGAGQLGQNLFQFVGYLGVFVSYFLFKNSEYSILYFAISLGIFLISFVSEVAYYLTFKESNKIEIKDVKEKRHGGKTENGVKIDTLKQTKERLNKKFFVSIVLHLFSLFIHFAILLSYYQPLIIHE